MALPLAKVPSLAGFPSSNRAQRRDSLNFPLLRFNSPSWFILKRSLLSHFVTENTSHGVLSSLQRLRQRKSTSFRFTEKLLRLVLTDKSDVRQQLPHCQLRCHSQTFSASQRLCSSRYPSAIFRQITLLGLRSSGVYPSHTASEDSSPSDCPLDVPPDGCATLVLG
jgi:hypothetical protein